MAHRMNNLPMMTVLTGHSAHGGDTLASSAEMTQRHSPHLDLPGPMLAGHPAPEGVAATPSMRQVHLEVTRLHSIGTEFIHRVLTEWLANAKVQSPALWHGHCRS